MKRTVLSFDGTKIVYDLKKGFKDFFLVFLHGAGGDQTAWNNIRNILHKKGLSTIAIDLRGHGLSQKPLNSKNYYLENFAKDVECVLLKESVKDFIIIGHCFGGMVAVTYEKIFPKKAKAFILISTNYKSPKILKAIFSLSPLLKLAGPAAYKKEEKKEYLINYNHFINTGDWDLERIYAGIKQTSFYSWLKILNSASKFDGTKTLEKMLQPCLVIVGGKDSIFRPKVSRKIAELIKDSQLTISPNDNHIIVLNNPKIICQETLSFLEKKGFI